MDENKKNGMEPEESFSGQQPQNPQQPGSSEAGGAAPGSGWVFSEQNQQASQPGNQEAQNNSRPGPEQEAWRTGEYHGRFTQDHAQEHGQTGSNRPGYDSRYHYSTYQNPDPSNSGAGPQPQPDQGYQWNYEDYQEHQQPREPGKKKGKNKGLMVFGILLCVVLGLGVLSLAGYGVYAMVSQNTAQEQTTEGDTPVEEEPSADAHLTLNDKPASSGQQEAQLSTGELTIPERAKKVQPSVVGIVAYEQGSNVFTGSQSYGSGIIASADGYIITNAHVVEGASVLKVVLHDNTEYTATLVGMDTKTDLAVIKIEAEGLQAAEFGNSDQLEIGDQVIAIGNPGGLELAGSVTVGYVSALNRPINNGTVSAIQTDAAINPGNSGGALVNSYGQVIGINSAKIAATDYEGIGFAISINDAQPIIDDLINYGYVKGRVRMGISVVTIDQLQAQMYGYQPGAGVAAVEQDSTAAAAGLVAGDIITAVDGQEIQSSDDLIELLEGYKPGDTVELTVFRKSLQSYGEDKVLTIKVELMEAGPETTTGTAQSIPNQGNN